MPWLRCAGWVCRWLTVPRSAVGELGSRLRTTHPASVPPLRASSIRLRCGSRLVARVSTAGATWLALTGGNGNPAAPQAFVTAIQHAVSSCLIAGSASPGCVSWMMSRSWRGRHEPTVSRWCVIPCSRAADPRVHRRRGARARLMPANGSQAGFGPKTSEGPVFGICFRPGPSHWSG